MAKQPRDGPSPFELEFRRASAIFDTPLAAHGFALAGINVEPTFGTRSYTKDGRYVKVVADVDPREFPFHSNVQLGEGVMTMPESDWNCIALWHLFRHLAQSDQESAAQEYPLPDEANLVPLFERMLSDLLRHGAGFLHDDLSVFRSVRAALARSRKPYTIHKPDGRGGYVSIVDPASSALKERFSREQ